MTLKDSALQEYAELLAAAGFKIYEPKDPFRDHFLYSQVVDLQECFGVVQKEIVGSGYKHAMPIRPSQEHGSSMFVGGVPDELTVEVAKAVAQPTNWNKVVGTHKNFRDADDLERRYK